MDSRRNGFASVQSINISQQITKPKLYTYLLLQNRHPEILSDFSGKKWFCHGYGCLGLYAQYLEAINKDINCKLQHTEQKTQQTKDIPDTNKTLDTAKNDWPWFQKQLEIISNWNGNIDGLSNSDKKNIDHLIKYLNLFQNSNKYLHISQGKLHRILVDSEQRKIKLEYSFAGLFTAEDFTKKLNLKYKNENNTTNFFTLSPNNLIEILTQYDQRLILISCGNHTLTLFKSGSEISFYHANQKFGRCIYNHSSIKELVNAMFKAYKFNQTQPSPFGFRIFTFDKHIKKYPEANLLLEQFNHPFITDTNCKKMDYSALHIATRIGSKKCVKYYLDKGVDIDYQTKKKTTALYIATSRNHCFIMQMLLLKDADINKPCGKKHESPLIKACQSGNLKLVNAMLEYSQKITFKDFMTVLFHLKGYNLQYDFIHSINPKIAVKIFNDSTLINKQLKDFSRSEHYNNEIHLQIKSLLYKYKNLGAEKMKLLADEARLFNNKNKHKARDSSKKNVSSNSVISYSQRIHYC